MTKEIRAHIMARSTTTSSRATSRPAPGYFIAVGLLGLGILFAAMLWLNRSKKGMGVTNLHQPMTGESTIGNFVYWVGLAHSGTLISAIFFLTRAKWRDAVSRATEAMTLICHHDRRLVPADPPRAGSGSFTTSSPIRARGRSGPISQPAALGHARNQHLSYRQHDFLLCRPAPGPRRLPRHLRNEARPEPLETRLYRVLSLRLVGRGRAVAPLPAQLSVFRRPGHAAGDFGPLDSFLGFCGEHPVTAGTRPCSPPISSPAPSTRASPWHSSCSSPSENC